MERSDNARLASATRLLCALMLSSLNALVKATEAAGVSLGEVLFFRQALTVPIAALLVCTTAGPAALATRRPIDHIVRTISGLAGMACLYFAVHRLSLPQATILTFTVPIFATLLAGLVLGEVIGAGRWAAVGIGFLGVLVVARPSGRAIDPAGLAAGLCYGITTAVVSLQLRRIGRSEAPLSTVFWFALLSMPILLPLYLLYIGGHPPGVWLMLGGIGILGAATQVALTWSLRLGPVSLVLPLDYSGLLWATVLGWLCFGDAPAATMLLGAPLIILAGLLILLGPSLIRGFPGGRLLGAAARSVARPPAP